jgi:MFS transporter, FHS family, L-fucose permease
MKKEYPVAKVIPVLFGFFIVGFVDLVGVANSYVKSDFELSDSMANLLPMMVFLWFAVFAVPASLLMNSIGRKRTVLLSMLVTLAALIIPIAWYSFAGMLIAFSLIGIGNTILQVSVNPLLSNVISGERLASGLTFGQFIKAVAAFFGPVICLFSASALGSWKYIFAVYSVILLLAATWLYFTKIEESPAKEKTSSFRGCFKLLNDKIILILFLGIVFVVGIDVGLNTAIPKFLMERFDIPLERAGLGSSLYFISRLAGTLLGAIILMKVPGLRFLITGMAIAIAGMTAIQFIFNMWVVLVLFFVVGFAVANVFSILFSIALKYKPFLANEISGLMIMGIAGGAVILPMMGIMSDFTGQAGGLLILLGSMIYLFISALGLQKITAVPEAASSV